MSATRDASLERVAGRLDAGSLLRHAPREVDGVSLAATLRPADGDALARTLRGLREEGLAAIPLGAGLHLGLGNPPARADVLLSTERLAGVDELDAAEGVCHVRAGTRLADLRARANDCGELPLDAGDDRASVGGVLASAAVGPRSQGFGPPRDAVLGLEVVLASGDATHCGGRVVKNVTGYDLNKLYTGSLGSLGVIAGAWLRLRPIPARVSVYESEHATLAAGCEAAVVASRRATTRACALAAGDPPRCVVELAGDAPSVERDAAWLTQTLDARGVGEEALREVAHAQHATPAPSGLRFRLAVLPSRLAAAVEELAGAGAALLAYPGLRLVYAGFAFPEVDDRGVEAAFAAVRAVAGRASGPWRCEWAPLEAKRERDVFGDCEAPVLTRALKARFDPDGVLNPGRFAGRI